MIAGLDSAFPPSAASLIAAKNAGVRLWAGYFAGTNIYHGWSHNDFIRVKATGLATLAFCSGWSDPAAMKAQSAAWGVPICLDVEGGIRGDGSWVQHWLDVSGAGLYGNAPVFAGKRAAFYILAAYPGFNPQRTWSGTPPGQPCGWQWQGTHSAYGASVDSAWYDDGFLSTFGPDSGTIGDDMASKQDIIDALKESGVVGGETSLYNQLVTLNANILALTTALNARSGTGGAPEPSSVILSVPAQTITGTLK